MFGWFRKADEKPEKQDSPKVLCEHLHWTIHGWNTIGFGSCLDCGEQIGLDGAFNKLHEKMEATIAEAEKEISALRNARSNAIGQRGAACGASAAPTGCASNVEAESNLQKNGTNAAGGN